MHGTLDREESSLEGKKKTVRILMIGNNVKRDIRGGNRFGIRTALLTWSKRRSFEPEEPEDVPTYRICEPKELAALVHRLENEN